MTSGREQDLTAGCPRCGARSTMLSVRGDIGWAAIAARQCPACGYQPSDEELRRWVAAMLNASARSTGTSLDDCPVTTH